MAREAPEIRLIRETLEGVLHPSEASATLFEALAANDGPPPRTPAECLALVQGPLAEILSVRLGESESEMVLSRLEMMLGSVAGSPTQARSRHEMTTASVALSGDIMPVFVLSRTKSFADKLNAALGPGMISTVCAGHVESLAARLSLIAPGFVLIDGEQFPSMDPKEMMELLRPLPSQVVKAVWGADLPYGEQVLLAGDEVGVSLTPFDREEGIAPLMDVIRSRAPA